MAINVFKKHPGNKITFSNRAILSGELKIMGLGLRWYFVSMVPGSVECKTCCLLYITLVNSLSSASSTSSSTVLWCCSQRPERMPRRMTACSRFDRRPSRSPTMSLRRIHELRNDDWLEGDVDWSSCHAVGPEYSQGMGTLWTHSVCSEMLQQL